MKIYVGYIIDKFSTAVCMSANKSVVKEELYNLNAVVEGGVYIKEYEVGNELIDLDCD